ncbi:MAG: L-seryl-tRNA(Sec) selenium transferase [Burkholderiaceae bacterium]
MTRTPDESVVHGSKAPLRKLPSVDTLLRSAPVASLVERHGRTLVAAEARRTLDRLRQRLRNGEPIPTASLAPEALAEMLADGCARRLAPPMRRVINLTGTVIHTNLGRALLSDAVMAEAQALMTAPNNLEFDLEDGGRGDRDALVGPLLCELTGAEAATVVNNNAAAVLLTVAALARGREVIVSRGELIEIGGAFRMPDVMASAGATLVEVGTTNRTHAADYRRAITERTALIMKVHPSNYAIEGFTTAVGEAELASIAHGAGLPLATDLGSGALIDLADHGLPREPLPQQSLADGCDVVTFSGDKLLGGPQAGLIVGSRDAIARIRAHPMKRALRMSKLPLAVLSATLRLYLCPEKLAERLPTLRLLTRPRAAIDETARALHPVVAEALRAPPTDSPDAPAAYDVEVVALDSQIGSGSLPRERLPSAGLAIRPRDGSGRTLDALVRALRELPIPVIGRIDRQALLLDLRCLEDPREFVEQLPRLQQRLHGPRRS